MLGRTVVISILLAALAVPAAADYESALVLGTGYAIGPPTWTPWEKIELDIQSEHLIPVVYERRLLLGVRARFGAARR